MLAEGGGEAVGSAFDKTNQNPNPSPNPNPNPSPNPNQVGSAFDKVLRHALSPLDAPTLLRAAAR